MSYPEELAEKHIAHAALDLVCRRKQVVAAAIEEAIEKCAKVCDRIHGTTAKSAPEVSASAAYCAGCIRKLAAKESGR